MELNIVLLLYDTPGYDSLDILVEDSVLSASIKVALKSLIITIDN